MNRFRFLLSGQACSTLGDILYILSLVTTLYRQSGSAAVAALFPLLRVIGMTVGSFGAPLVLRRYRLSGLLAFCLTVQCGGLAAMALYLQAAASRPQVEWLTGGVLILSMLEGAAGPARSSLLPRIVHKDELLKANGTLAAVVQTCSLAGWAAGALVVSGLGAGPSLWTAAVLLLLSAISALLLGKSDAEPLAAADSSERSEPAARSLLQGWKVFLRLPALRLLLWMDLWDGLCAAVFAGALLLVFAEERLMAGEVWWGWMNGAYCAGLIAANWGIGRFWKDAEKRLGVLLQLGAAGMAVTVLCFSLTVRPAIALGVMLLIGIAESAKYLAATTLLQLATPEKEMPSVFAAQSTLLSALFGISLLLAGWLADRYGIQTIYIGAAVCYTLSFLGAAWRRQAVKEVSHEQQVSN